MTQHSIIEHRANYFFIRLEDDYLAMHEKINEEIEALGLPERQDSGPADCKAMISAVLEQWMNSKRPNAKCEEDLFVYFTYDEWEHQLRYRYKRSTIIRCLKEMPMEGQWLDEQDEIHVGTIKVRHYIQNTYAYMLNTPVVQGLLAALPDQSPYGPRPKTPLGRPRKNHSKINGLKKDGINLNRLKTDGNTEIPSENTRNNDEIPFKNKRSFYTQNSNYTDITNTQISGVDANAQHPPTLASVIRQENAAYDALIVESTIEDITEQSPLGSYSQQDATRNALVENGEDHDPTRSRRPRVDDHNLSGNADSLSLPAAADSSRTTQAQQIALQENDNNSHSHEERHDNGLSDTTPPGLVGAVRSAVAQDADRSGSSQGSGPDTRRLPVANSTASGGVGCGVRGKARAQAEGAATAGAGGRSGTSNGDDASSEVAPHQGRAQGKKAVGSRRKVQDPSKKPDLLAQLPQEVVAIIVEWQGIFTKPVPVTPKLIEHATVLSASQPVDGEIAQCRLWMYATDKNKWYSTHGMNLGDVARDFERFRSLGYVPQSQPSRQKSVTTSIPQVLSPEEEAKKKASLERARAAKQAILAEQAAQKAYEAQLFGGVR